MPFVLDPTSLGQLQGGPVIILIAIIVQIIMHVAEYAFGAKGDLPPNGYNKLVSRLGPILNVGLGVLVGVLGNYGFAYGIIGGAAASWTYAVSQKTLQGK